MTLLVVLITTMLYTMTIADNRGRLSNTIIVVSVIGMTVSIRSIIHILIIIIVSSIIMSSGGTTCLTLLA